MLTLLTLSRAFFVFAVALVAYSLTVPPIASPVSVAPRPEPTQRAHPTPAELTELEELGDAAAHGVIVCVTTATWAMCE